MFLDLEVNENEEHKTKKRFMFKRPVCAKIIIIQGRIDNDVLILVNPCKCILSCWLPEVFYYNACVILPQLKNKLIFNKAFKRLCERAWISFFFFNLYHQYTQSHFTLTTTKPVVLVAHPTL